MFLCTKYSLPQDSKTKGKLDKINYELLEKQIYTTSRFT